MQPQHDRGVPPTRLKLNVAQYYDEAEKQGWPDRLNRGRFKYGWDSEMKRGFAVSRNVHLVLPGADRDREWQRVKLGMELEWSYYGPFGFALVLSEPGDNFTMATSITAEILQQKEVLIFGTADEVGEKLLKVKDAVYGDDFNITIWFELGGFQTEEIEEQMQYFMEAVTPGLARACGGQLKNPEVNVQLVPPLPVRV